MIIKTHKDLAEFIAGKGVLHLNSLGKDSAVCLEWLTKFAHPSRIVSVNFAFLANHPGDQAYINYQKKKYPEVEFITRWNPPELSYIAAGEYQSPLYTMTEINSWEFEDFSMTDLSREIKESYGLDFMCDGASKYEDFSRRVLFHQKGIAIADKIYPLGMMSKEQVIGIIKASGVKLHPCYKLAKSTLDHPSYWKMRASFIANPEYKKKVYTFFPLLKLDEYRYEKLLR